MEGIVHNFSISKTPGNLQVLIIGMNQHFKDKTTAGTDQQNTAQMCLQIQHLLMTLSIDNCYTFKRWKVVHNFLLENLTGIPLISKLRVIHIYDADLSVIQKFYVSHKIKT
jgi:hypothetical protein